LKAESRMNPQAGRVALRDGAEGGGIPGVLAVTRTRAVAKLAKSNTEKPVSPRVRLFYVRQLDFARHCYFYSPSAEKNGQN
jgi:hypothetical protein